MAAHRHWRLYIVSQSSTNYCSVAELELRETLAGTNHALSGTMSAISTYDVSLAPAYAADGDINTMWHSQYIAGGAGGWIACDLGSGNDKSINVISITPRNDGYPVNPISEFELQFSDDGSSWTTLYGDSGITGWSAGVAKTWDFTPSGGPAGPASTSTPNAAFMTFRG